MSSTFRFQLIWDLCSFSGVSWLLPPVGGFHYLQNTSKGMTQNIVYNPWGGTKSPWLGLMAKKKFFFRLAWLFSFFPPCIFLLLWWSFPLTKVFLYRQKVSGGHGGKSIWGRPQRVLLSYRSAGHTLFLIRVSGLKSLKTTEVHTSISVCETPWAAGTHVLLHVVDLSCVSLWKKAERRVIDAFELCCGENSWKSFGQPGDQTSQF